MKRIGTLCAGLLFGACALLQAQSLAHPLTGIWQQLERQQTENNDIKLYAMPVWKLIQTDGNFSLIVIPPKTNASFKTTEGTYTIDTDSTYTETIRKSAINPSIEGTKTNLKYKLFDDEMLIISYKLANSKKEGREIWKRVSLPKPQNN